MDLTKVEADEARGLGDCTLQFEYDKRWGRQPEDNRW